MKRFLNRFTWSLVLAVLAIGFWGCAEQKPETPTEAAHEAEGHAEEKHAAEAGTEEHAAHSHTEGPHGGLLAVLGSHEYHAEVLADHGTGKVTLFLSDAKFQPITVAVKEVRLNLMVDGKPKQYVLKVAETIGPDQPIPFTLTDVELAELLDEGWAGEARVAVELDGAPYTGALAQPEKDHDDHDHHEGEEEK